jgi:hypothetical protein
MPQSLIPRRSGRHRIAAIALYRALLLQCRAITLPRIQRDELQNIVRNRFHDARHNTSPRQLTTSFEAGYEAIDHLDAAVAGNEENKSYIVSLLERAPLRVKQPKPSAQAPDKPASPIANPDTQPKLSIFDRPLTLEKLSGKRHVPVLFSANRIPVLRVKKPQPESLSGYIRARIEQRQGWHDRRHRLLEEVDLASHEDTWDEIIAKTAGPVPQDTRAVGWAKEPRWRDVPSDGLGEVLRMILEEKKKNMVMAEKMQNVVDREQHLFDMEKAERKEKRTNREMKVPEQGLEH